MAIFRSSPKHLLLLHFFVFIISVTTQPLPSPRANFSCSANSLSSCPSYVAYIVQGPEFIDLGSISDLFGVSRLSISQASNLASEDDPLYPGQLLLIPITCGCSGGSFFANITYQIKKDDSYFLVSTKAFENLTNWQVEEEMNPGINPTLLQIGTQVTIPLYCKCLAKADSEAGFNFLVTYVWQPGDALSSVAKKFNATSGDIVKENKGVNLTASVGHPVLIPVSQLPALSQPLNAPPKRKESKHEWIIVALSSVAAAILVTALAVSLVYVRRLGGKANPKILNWNASCWEVRNLVKTKEFPKEGKSESSKTKVIQDKLLPSISDYLSIPIMYGAKEIMEATMNLDESSKIRGSVFRGTIDGKVFAVKTETMGKNMEELKILQRVNHANLIKLLGVSSDAGGNFFMVYEYAENGSLDKWLCQRPSSSSESVNFLTWIQRLGIAFDVANGLQYLHEHTQPSIVHGDIRASNILLDSNFKAKISNFSKAIPATSAAMLKVDIYAFGLHLLELLSGKRAMGVSEVMEILEAEENREERLMEWMDPDLGSFYPIHDALSLATLAQACTAEESSVRPSMAEIAFNLCMLAQSSSVALESSWTTTIEADESVQVIIPATAR
ncbi:serine/threonine receptor-like kinase NFP [Rhodamnia argentea]|uniref:Serine/threonine receptor-like kinase NFP n=1 Tax=Rhodamnia argentea TaxID=178133 RepID=A0A8B8MTF9_9MYRT|nr:serine/threonine receptor-like kinase NFP [Rhodamnia argentea]